MGKRIRDYVRYTVPELENYTKTVESCVKKVRNRMHLNLPPYALINIKKTILQVIETKKIGFFDSRLQGIILDVRNIKIMGDVAQMNFCDPNIHLDIEADCYVFQPQIGSVVRGIVKHISSRQIGVIIYRVFSVSVRLEGDADRTLKLNSEVGLRIKKLDLQNAMPFIEGELLAEKVDKQNKMGILQPKLQACITIGDSSDSGEESEQVDLLGAVKAKSKGGMDLKAERTNYLKSKNITSNVEGNGGNICDIKGSKKSSGEGVKNEITDLVSSEEDNHTPTRPHFKREEHFKHNDILEQCRDDVLPDMLVPQKSANSSFSNHKLKKREKQKNANAYENLEQVLNGGQKEIKSEHSPSFSNKPERRSIKKEISFDFDEAAGMAIKCEIKSENETKSTEGKKSKRGKRRKSGDFQESGDCSLLEDSASSKKKSKRDELNNFLMEIKQQSSLKEQRATSEVEYIKKSGKRRKRSVELAVIAGD